MEFPAGHLDLPGIFYPATTARTGLLLVLAHGAGAGQQSPFMRRYSEHFAALGLDAFTFDFPYMALRKKVPDRPPVLEEAFLAAVAAAVAVAPQPTRAVVVGGKSMGGRMATHLAAQPERWTSAVRLAGAVAFGYPLRPPGARGGDRVSHLHRLAVPACIVQGTRDTFGGPDDIRAAVGELAHLRVLSVPTGDHSLKVLASSGRPQSEVERHIVAQVAGWMAEVTAG
jgi:predicted alpha/beta-hydrolase family hydrolase